MSRTKGSGWGAGPILYQKCPKCEKKKAYFDPVDYGGHSFKCTWCGHLFYSDTHLRFKYAEQVRRLNEA